MLIGDRLRELREAKKLSQGDIEKRCGLKRAYISRVEHGHTVPSIETLEKLARALEVPLYQLFYEGEEPPALPRLPKQKTAEETAWGSTGKEARVLSKFSRLLARMDEADRNLLLHMAQKMARRHYRGKISLDIYKQPGRQSAHIASYSPSSKARAQARTRQGPFPGRPRSGKFDKAKPCVSRERKATGL